jgi:hypothetical protein
LAKAYLGQEIEKGSCKGAFFVPAHLCYTSPDNPQSVLQCKKLSAIFLNAISSGWRGKCFASPGIILLHKGLNRSIYPKKLRMTNTDPGIYPRCIHHS